MRRLWDSQTGVTPDLLCLAAIVLLSALPYILGLGFYSDDWGVIPGLRAELLAGRSPLDLPQLFAPRPVQGYYLILLVEMFGLNPLGYHLVNTGVIAGSVLLFYLLLIRVRAEPAVAFAIAVVFTILPQLSTVRAWVLTAQIPLSMLFMLASAHAQLSFARSGRIAWLAAALAAAALSIAAYEIFAPLILGFGLWLVVARVRSRGVPAERRRTALLLGSAIVAIVVGAALLKIVLGDRAGPTADPQRYLDGLHQLIRPDYDWRVDSSLNIFAAVSVHFWHTTKGWADALLWLVKGGAGALATISAAVIAALTLWRLLSSHPRADEALGPVTLLLIGAVAFILGHAAFLIVPWISFSPTGMGNRVLVAAAIGVAILFVAAIAAALRAAPHRTTIFAVVIALIAGLGALRTAQIGGYWAEASDVQHRLLGAAATDLRAVPAGSTVILDGFCPYHGPAPVFETSWDTAGALSVALGREIAGDIVSPRMRVTGTGLETSMYEEPAFYPFAPNLYVYNVGTRLVQPLPDAAAARRYFGKSRSTEPTCPPSYISHGVLLEDAEKS